MKSSSNDTRCVWTVSEAKTHLSEVLRRAEEEPQQIGKRRPCIVVSARQWHANNDTRMPIGKWLVDNVPRGVGLNVHFDRKSGREIPFKVGETE